LLRFCKLKDYNLLGMKDAFRKKTLRRFCGDFCKINRNLAVIWLNLT